MEVAISRLTKPRFPQGSEVWITVCPKFGTTAKIGTDPSGNEQAQARDPQGMVFAMGPPLFRMVAVFLSERVLGGFRSLAVDFALGPHRIPAAWLYRRRDECDADRGRDGEAV